jgi:hypothetical protein
LFDCPSKYTLGADVYPFPGVFTVMLPTEFPIKTAVAVGAVPPEGGAENVTAGGVV